MLPGDDRSILEAFRRGDSSVLTQVYRAYSPEVLRYLSRRFAVRTGENPQWVGLSPLDLDAAHQETFVRAFRPSLRQAYDGVRPYVGFLLTVARSAAIDLMRASGRISREAVPMEDTSELRHLATEGRSPEEVALEAEVRTLVRSFLEGLSPETRALAQLRFMEELSQESAAERLGLTRAELRVRERHLRTQFTEYLTASGWLETGPASEQLGLKVILVAMALSGFWSTP
ncbi:RNA polymerase sigma factor [Hyalangium versicolor]|uniref:RNA polymerase sigma factor n=1 Tax=Hyalangium versicolor TaxID=2861190 RepID=UPI001CC9CDAB|nr:sigma-70 family RNA polymerase sigma factor [Hyalangium versicolor]